jgi:uncharacterized repeat protein (TIGR01451 family)
MTIAYRHFHEMIVRSLLVALLLGLELIPASALSAITLDGVSSASGNTSSLAWSHTIGSGSNGILIVGVSNRRSNRTVTNVTYGGQSLTRIGIQVSGGNTSRLEMWYLLAPPQGTALLTVNLSGNTDVIGGAVSYFGVDQLAPMGTFSSTGGTGSSATVTITSAIGELVVGAIAAPGTAQSLTPGSGQISNWNVGTGTSGANERGAGSSQDGASSVMMSWGLGASADWAIGAVSLRPTPNPNVELMLSQSSSNPPPGTDVTYTISYQNTGVGQAGNTAITLPVPPHTSYVSNSVILNGMSKTDVADADEVTLSGSTITVNLGGVPTGSSGILTYHVIIQ